MKEESNIMQQGNDAVWQLFQVLQQLIGTSMGNCLQDMPGQLVRLSNQVSQVETKQQQFFKRQEPAAAVLGRQVHKPRDLLRDRQKCAQWPRVRFTLKLKRQ